MGKSISEAAPFYAARGWRCGRMPDASRSFDVVVVGAGPAGLAAACVAAESGQRVGLVDETPWLGGQIWRGQDHKPKQGPGTSIATAKAWFARFRNSGATLLDQTTVVAAPETGLLLAEKEGAPIQLRWKKLVL